jgi:hypothetical protein
MVWEREEKKDNEEVNQIMKKKIAKERKSSRALTYSTDNIFSKPFMSSPLTSGSCERFSLQYSLLLSRVY